MLALVLALMEMLMLQSKWVLYPFLSIGANANANALCEWAFSCGKLKLVLRYKYSKFKIKANQKIFHSMSASLRDTGVHASFYGSQLFLYQNSR